MNLPPIMYRGQFALLWHQRVLESGKDDSHWDLLLELDSGELLTWRIDRTLELSNLAVGQEQTSALIAAMQGPSGNLQVLRLPDHRSVYLHYQGPIDGNRGSVTQVASGRYEAQQVEPRCSLENDYPMVGFEESKTASQSIPLPAALPLLHRTRVCLISPTFTVNFIVDITPIGDRTGMRHYYR